MWSRTIRCVLQSAVVFCQRWSWLSQQQRRASSRSVIPPPPLPHRHQPPSRKGEPAVAVALYAVDLKAHVVDPSATVVVIRSSAAPGQALSVVVDRCGSATRIRKSVRLLCSPSWENWTCAKSCSGRPVRSSPAQAEGIPATGVALSVSAAGSIASLSMYASELKDILSEAYELDPTDWGHQARLEYRRLTRKRLHSDRRVPGERREDRSGGPKDTQLQNVAYMRTSVIGNLAATAASHRLTRQRHCTFSRSCRTAGMWMGT